MLTRARVGLICCGLLLPCAAHAQTDDASRASARDIGAAGVKAYQAGDFATASDKLEKAYRVLRVPSIGLWSARALSQRGKWVEATERLREVARLPTTEGDSRVQQQAQADAATELSALSAKVPGVVVQLEGADPEQVKVSIDGVVIPQALIGERRPVNPGAHLIEGTVGGDHQTAQVTVAEGESKSVLLHFQGAAATPAAAGPTFSATGAISSSPPEKNDNPPPGAHSGVGTQRVIALVVAGVGLGGVAVGTLFGLQAKSKHDDAAGRCANGFCQDAGSLAASNDARKAGNVSTIAFIVGAAGLAGGAALWFTAKPSSASAQTSLGVGVGSLYLARRW